MERNKSSYSYISDRIMLLQCLKCSLFYRSFSKLKAHKSAGPCADKLKLKKKEDKVDDITKSIQETKIYDDNNTLEENLGDNLNEQIKTEPNDIKKEIKTEPRDQHIKEEYATNIKLEPEYTSKEEYYEEHETSIKLEPKDTIKVEDQFDTADPAGFEYYDDAEEYVPAPIVVIDSDDEYEPESDDSAPDDDDVEAVRISLILSFPCLISSDRSSFIHLISY